MNCGYCHAPLGPDAQFCPNCGRPVAVPAAPAPLPFDETVYSPAPTSDKKRMSGWLVAVIILTILAICCMIAMIAAYIMFSNNQSSQNKQLAAASLVQMETTLSAQATSLALQMQALELTTTPQPQQVLPQSGELTAPNWQESGLKIWVDESLMQGVELKYEDPILPGGYLPWEYAPMHLALEMQNPKGFIHLVPVDAYVPMGEFAQNMIRDLQLTVDNKPAVAAWGCIPTWAFPCEHQEMHANVYYLDFQNGSGIRSVTAFQPQDISAINNQTIAYYFNGLSEDGLFYVYALFEIRHSALSENDWNIPQEIYTDLTGEKMKAYIIQNAETLESKPDGYQPSLEKLDVILQSLRVELDW